MGFVDAIKTCMTKYITFSGRGQRSEYWWFYLFTFVLSIIPFIGAIASLVLLIPSLAASWRRLHDSDMSGWYVFLPMVAMPIVGIGAFLESNILMGIGGIALIGLGFYVLYLLIRKGTDGTNRFGPDPLSPVSEDLQEVFS